METHGQKSIQVLVIMGSDSDWEVMVAAGRQLEEFGITHRVHVTSAHRTPERTVEIVHQAEHDGCQVIIAGAGAAAHLAGVVAAHTVLPVIGVPLNATSLGGLDALLSTVQMPAGIPVATVAVGAAGAANAALLAVQIIALGNPDLAAKLGDHRRGMAAKVADKDRRLQEQRLA
ncbi:MAG: 5-(carboxyamino)imidazole ribonucleotide mutase [Deltaproteobacteria bacterium]|nr:5-(carboxyamino)imidazole ribonucleotide mutase [Candidatus Anaeroferrophillacea bacterium]